MLAAPDLDTLVERIWAAAKADADRAHAALASRAPVDEIAARVLLQVLRPGLRNLGRRLALGGSFEGLLAAVAEGAKTPASAHVVWRTRVQEHDDAEVPAALGVEVRTLQRRRQRAERQLAAVS